MNNYFQTQENYDGVFGEFDKGLKCPVSLLLHNEGWNLLNKLSVNEFYQLAIWYSEAFDTYQMEIIDALEAAGENILDIFRYYTNLEDVYFYEKGLMDTYPEGTRELVDELLYSGDVVDIGYAYVGPIKN